MICIKYEVLTGAFPAGTRVYLKEDHNAQVAWRFRCDKHQVIWSFRGHTCKVFKGHTSPISCHGSKGDFKEKHQTNQVILLSSNFSP